MANIRRLTLTLSRAVGRLWSVFWPQTTKSWKSAYWTIGLIALRLPYIRSLSSRVGLLNTSVMPGTMPLVTPAGANHGAPRVSLLAYTAMIEPDGGTHTSTLL